MIIVGDVACPNESYSQKLAAVFERNVGVFGNNSLICNLEGLICEDISHLPQDTPVLYNHPTVLDALFQANLAGVGMANNHTLDLPEYFQKTSLLLKENNVPFAGAGNSLEEAREPFKYMDGSTEVLVFNYCWDFLLYHQNNPSKGVYVAELDERSLLHQVGHAKKENPNIKILVFVHWSFDLETLPFPMYRQFSRLLIDAGVSLVVGCHSHCVQGGEKYKDGYIVYGLGNFFLPHHVYAGGKLSFPEMSDTQLAFEYDFNTGKAVCHWFKYNQESETLVDFVRSEDFSDSQMLSNYSPYAHMDEFQYKQYFKSNRRKSFLVPIYTDIRKRFLNQIFTRWLKMRAGILRGLAKYNLRKWQN